MNLAWTAYKCRTFFYRPFLYENVLFCIRVMLYSAALGVAIICTTNNYGIFAGAVSIVVCLAYYWWAIPDYAPSNREER